MQHTHYVGPGFEAKMKELDDSPATCEPYPFVAKLDGQGKVVPSELAGEISLAVGKSGMLYIYTPETGVNVYPTLDMLIAGGVV